jgi:hypothetical protein
MFAPAGATDGGGIGVGESGLCGELESVSGGLGALALVSRSVCFQYHLFPNVGIASLCQHHSRARL